MACVLVAMELVFVVGTPYFDVTVATSIRDYSESEGDLHEIHIHLAGSIVFDNISCVGSTGAREKAE